MKDVEIEESLSCHEAMPMSFGIARLGRAGTRASHGGSTGESTREFRTKHATTLFDKLPYIFFLGLICSFLHARQHCNARINIIGVHFACVRFKLQGKSE